MVERARRILCSAERQHTRAHLTYTSISVLASSFALDNVDISVSVPSRCTCAEDEEKEEKGTDLVNTKVGVIHRPFYSLKYLQVIKCNIASWE